MKTIVLGLGNSLLSDDGAGILAARQLRQLLGGIKDVEVAESSWGGFRIIDLLRGYDQAIIIDAIKTGKKPVGYLHLLDGKTFIHSVRMVSFHDINFATALEFARMLSIPMPESVMVYAIEAAETELFSNSITPKVRDAIDQCVRQVADKLRLAYPVPDRDDLPSIAETECGAIG